MIGEIIAIGDELTSGRITNTTSGFAARELFAAGHDIYAMHTIGDQPELIGEALNRALSRVDFVIVTGGLGATTDDLTNEAVVKALGINAVINEGVMASLKSRLRHSQKEHMIALQKLAWLPENAEVLDSAYRMAGYMLPYKGKPIFFLPGVPPQMRELLTNKVLQRLAAWKAGASNPIRQRVYRTFGLMESEINNRLLNLEEDGLVQIGYYPVGCEVHVSLTTREADGQNPDTLFDTTDQAIREALGRSIYGTGKTTLASVTGELLKDKEKTLCVAESCTGGLIGSKITQIAGSSQWFAGGVIAYSNMLKEKLLNVDRAMLINYGAVSGIVARAMAARLADRLQTDMAISVTGIAGPEGGTEEKPVGTVYFGLFHNNKVTDHLFYFHGSRTEIQERTAHTALDLLRRALLEP